MASHFVRFAKHVVHYKETVPVISSKEWLRGEVPSDPKAQVFGYLKGLFPFLQWIGRYNTGWLLGDIVAGLTVGIVLVPQSMSYAKIATLAPEYGLYSSFVGVLVYAFFATSKDVSIGPVAVMSLEVARVIQLVESKYPGLYTGPQIATNLAFMCGFIVLGIGLLRIAWIIDFIPAPAVSGFMTGSAISISTQQIPGLFGLQSRFNTRAAPYEVVINTLKNLKHTTRDAAFGLTGLFALYTIRSTLEWLSKRYPSRRRLFFFISILRNGLVLLVLTLASYLYCRHRKDEKGAYPISILSTVPRGFQHLGSPALDRNLISAFAPQLPVATIVLLLEHIAIAKSFGRVNGYSINPNQELIGIGVTNTFGTLFSAYPATGSFSRSALQAKSGSRTPAAGWISCIVVLIALYALTSAFYWIPNAGLCAVIIHAVADLVASPAQIYNFWRVSPLEFVIWWAAVIITVFTTIENGIYTSIIASLVLLLLRIARPNGRFLGRVTVRSEADPSISRDVYVPLTNREGLLNPQIKIERVSPGIIIYRPGDSVTYPNSSVVNADLVKYVKDYTRRGADVGELKLSERLWNDPGPSRGDTSTSIPDTTKPLLRAVILDFSTVSQIDSTGVQSLLDSRNEIERYADRSVEFHFASILSPWIRRTLVAAEFGIATEGRETNLEVASVFYSPEDEEFGYGDADDEPKGKSSSTRTQDVEENVASSSASTSETEFEGANGPILSRRTPFFHIDLDAAVRSAELGVKSQK